MGNISKSGAVGLCILTALGTWNFKSSLETAKAIEAREGRFNNIVKPYIENEKKLLLEERDRLKQIFGKMKIYREIVGSDLNVSEERLQLLNQKFNDLDWPKIPTPDP